MTEAGRCVQVRELAPEMALGVAPAKERARVLGHVTACADCRAYLAELAGVADDLLALAPSGEPPSGFESAVLAGLGESATPARPGEPGPLSSPGRPRPAQRRRGGTSHRVVSAAAVVVVIAVLSGGGVWWAHQADRELATGLRQTLATADGQYFTAFPLLQHDEVRRGAVFAYQGDPAWVLLTLDDPLHAGQYRVELVAHDGVTYLLAEDLDPSGTRAWSSEIPVAVHDATLLRVVDADGGVVLSAQVTQP